MAVPALVNRLKSLSLFGFVEFVKEWLPHWLVFAGVMGMTASSRFPDLDKAGLYFWLSFAASLGGQFWVWKREKQLSVLQKHHVKAVSELNSCRGLLRPLFDDYLARIAISMQLNADDRISLYRHTGNGFFCVGRYSSNPTFSKKGRPVYPDNEGCIGRAWANGEFEVLITSDFVANEQAYIAEMTAFNLGAETVKNLSMKCRGYWGIRINTSPTEPLGVLIVESLDAARIRSNTWKHGVVTTPELAKLAGMLQNTGSLLPDLNEPNQLLKQTNV